MESLFQTIVFAKKDKTHSSQNNLSNTPLAEQKTKPYKTFKIESYTVKVKNLVDKGYKNESLYILLKLLKSGLNTPPLKIGTSVN